MSSNGEFGELYPKLVIQEDERACLSACLLSETDPGLGLCEEDVSQVLIEDSLYEEGVGTGLYPAVTLDNSVRKLGLSASPVFDARLSEETGSAGDSEELITERLAKVETAVRDGQSVILAFPKRREGQSPFLHYAVVKGFKESADGDGVVLMDPSDVDGAVEHPSWEELREYVTPEPDIPVMAWAIGKNPRVDTQVRQIAEDDTGLAGFSLLGKPMWEKEDTGKAIPTGTDHPSSTVMPDSSISNQFNSLGDIVLSKDGNYPAGYPRFVVPPQVRELSLQVTGQTDALPFPSRRSAEASSHMERTYVHTGIEEAYGDKAAITERHGLFWLEGAKYNRDGWQHLGLGISSRQAAANLKGRPDNDLIRRAAAEQKIKGVLSEHTGAQPADIYLFPTGMAGIYWLNQALIKASGEAPGAQFNFPYTDTYEQRKYGPHKDVSQNVFDFRDGDYERLQELTGSGQEFRGIITEYPSNPLLATANLHRLDSIFHGDTPIIVDDTIGTVFNLDDSKLPDSVVARATSLTKFFSSVGDVMGGSVILRPESPYYEQVKQALDELYEDTLWYEDAEALAENSELFPYVMDRVNANGEAIADWLDDKWTGEGRALMDVYHPSLVDRENYDELKKPEGGYSGLLSLRFNDPNRAYKFFDRLKVTKGPSLGTYYTLGCLYTLLAHKPPGSVSKFGVVPDLIRLSIGIEDEGELKDRMEEAFQASA